MKLLVDRITERIEDCMGRWAGCIYNTQGLTLALILAYIFRSFSDKASVGIELNFEQILSS
jgi:hypothetical protein